MPNVLDQTTFGDDNLMAVSGRFPFPANVLKFHYGRERRAAVGYFPRARARYYRIQPRMNRAHLFVTTPRLVIRVGQVVLGVEMVESVYIPSMYPRSANTIFVPRVADQFDVLTALGQEQRNQRGRIRPE